VPDFSSFSKPKPVLTGYANPQTAYDTVERALNEFDAAMVKRAADFSDYTSFANRYDRHARQASFKALKQSSDEARQLVTSWKDELALVLAAQPDMCRDVASLESDMRKVIELRRQELIAWNEDRLSASGLNGSLAAAVPLRGCRYPE
jgi:plasmid stabilization system protein ParE